MYDRSLYCFLSHASFTDTFSWIDFWHQVRRWKHEQDVAIFLFYYVDIDEADRRQMHKSSVHRREQMISDGVNLVLDVDHWNRINPDQEPIQIEMDLTLDIQIRQAADEDEDEPADS